MPSRTLLLLTLLLAGPALAQPNRPAQPRPSAPPAETRAQPGRPGWAVDAQSGCWLWNPNPRPGATARWRGACPRGPAQGLGEAEWRWSEDGRPRLDRYAGTLRDGRVDGEGSITQANGDFYQGGLREWRPHGQGIAILGNGNRYIGEFEDGLRHGQGSMLWANGDQYDGQWRGDLPDGPGSLMRGAEPALSGQWRGGCLRLSGRLVVLDRALAGCSGNDIAAEAGTALPDNEAIGRDLAKQ